MVLFKKNFLFNDIKKIKGVGPQISKYLKKRKIDKIKDIILNLPYSETDRSDIVNIKNLERKDFVELCSNLSKGIPSPSAIFTGSLAGVNAVKYAISIPFFLPDQMHRSATCRDLSLSVIVITLAFIMMLLRLCLVPLYNIFLMMRYSVLVAYTSMHHLAMRHILWLSRASSLLRLV